MHPNLNLTTSGHPKTRAHTWQQPRSHTHLYLELRVLYDGPKIKKKWSSTFGWIQEVSRRAQKLEKQGKTWGEMRIRRTFML